MLKEERHRYIIDRINKDNRIYVTDLSVELKVSDDTLRRDLVELENSGLLTKVHEVRLPNLIFLYSFQKD